MIKRPVSVTIEADEKLCRKIKDDFSSFSLPCPTEYVVFHAKNDGIALSIFKPKNGICKILFQGEGSYNIAAKYDRNAIREKDDKPQDGPKMSILNKYPQIGSDEVGTGDFFGPIIVVASYVESGQLDRLAELGVTDSKLMIDEKIMDIGPILIKEFDYVALTLHCDKYNDVNKSNNMNAIKAKMHNKALSTLLKRHKDSSAYIDQFAEPKKYFEYLKGEKEVLNDVHFSTKGEKAFPSVALSSVIARYAFLQRINQLSEKYGVDIPLGASSRVDSFARKFVKKFGIEELNKIVKMNFSNYSRLSSKDE